MRPITLIIVAALAGCSEGSPATAPSSPSTGPAATQPATAPVAYDPATFRADVTRYVAAGHFKNAIALVNAADVHRQLKFDATGYLAVGEDMIVLPGVYPNVDYDPKRDWYMPGTQDAIQDGAWQAAATEFARRYNLRRAGKSG